MNYFYLLLLALTLTACSDAKLPTRTSGEKDGNSDKKDDDKEKTIADDSEGDAADDEEASTDSDPATTDDAAEGSDDNQEPSDSLRETNKRLLTGVWKHTEDKETNGDNFIPAQDGAVWTFAENETLRIVKPKPFGGDSIKDYSITFVENEKFEVKEPPKTSGYFATIVKITEKGQLELKTTHPTTGDLLDLSRYEWQSEGPATLP